MNKLFLPLVLVLSVVSGFALADQTTSISTTPWVEAFAPYVASIVSAVILGGLSILFAVLKKKWGLDIDQQIRDTITQTAQSAVNQQVAKLEGALGNRTIDVQNPMVVDATNYVIQKLPTELSHFNLKPDDVSKLILAQFGKIQANNQLPLAK